MPDNAIDKTTISKRPIPKRPRNGLLAWEATLGYIRVHLSADVLLKLQCYPCGAGVCWSAQVSWGSVIESVRDLPTIGQALRDLWFEVARNQTIYHTMEDAVKSPTNYREHEWLDTRTEDSFQRLVRVTDAVFQRDWMIMFIYQPIEAPDFRVQSRLVAENNTTHVGGRGPSLLDACHSLYTNAARSYSKAVNPHNHDEAG